MFLELCFCLFPGENGSCLSSRPIDLCICVRSPIFRGSLNCLFFFFFHLPDLLHRLLLLELGLEPAQTLRANPHLFMLSFRFTSRVSRLPLGLAADGAFLLLGFALQDSLTGFDRSHRWRCLHLPLLFPLIQTASSRGAKENLELVLSLLRDAEPFPSNLCHVTTMRIDGQSSSGCVGDDLVQESLFFQQKVKKPKLQISVMTCVMTMLGKRTTVTATSATVMTVTAMTS